MAWHRRSCKAGAALFFCAIAVTGVAQNYDILQDAHTSIYVETDYAGNDGRSNCDWYAAAPDLLAGSRHFGQGCQVIIRIRGIISREGAILFEDYFSGIGVDEKIVDDMFAVPFDEIHLLSRQELVVYGLYAD